MLHQNKQSKRARSDEWWTPHDLFWELVWLFNFLPMIDVCATESNSLRKLFFTKKDNALTRIWMIGKKKRKCFCNPPNSIMKLFLKKAYEQFRDEGIQTMMIVPLNIQSSANFIKYVREPVERGEKIFYRPIERRRSFLFKGRIPKKNDVSINGYCVIIFGRYNPFQKKVKHLS